jgi:hypothetical protein
MSAPVSVPSTNVFTIQKEGGENLQQFSQFSCGVRHNSRILCIADRLGESNRVPHLLIDMVGVWGILVNAGAHVDPLLCPLVPRALHDLLVVNKHGLLIRKHDLCIWADRLRRELSLRFVSTGTAAIALQPHSVPGMSTHRLHTVIYPSSPPPPLSLSRARARVPLLSLPFSLQTIHHSPLVCFLHNSAEFPFLCE